MYNRQNTLPRKFPAVYWQAWPKSRFRGQRLENRRQKSEIRRERSGAHKLLPKTALSWNG